MVDLMLWFNWTHISTVYSNDIYGQARTDELQKLTVMNEIECMPLQQEIWSEITSKLAVVLSKQHLDSH